MTILRVDASIQGPMSASSALADLVVEQITTGKPGESIITRHLGNDPLPATAWADAVRAGYVAEADRTPQQAEALALATALADELRSADAAVLAFPLYNWGISQHAKAWFDLVIAGAPMGERLLDGKPVVLITTRGGAYGPGMPKEGWDHGIGYAQRVLSEVWGAELTVIERELTLVGVVPAMDAFGEPAELSKKFAEEAAREAGLALATR